MLNEFEKHISENFPDLHQKKLLLAVSGGIDSMVMLYLFNELFTDFSVAHCNFNLRGEESKGDERFVEEVTSGYSKQLFIKQFDTLAYARENGLNTQLSARELRYAWFYELCEAHGFDHIVIAHHANDRLETFLINLSRGTGIEGLKGIPETNGKIIRPLLPFSREQITDYAQANAIVWREDSSNDSDKYLRNKIRHHITPLLKELHPDFLNNFLKTQEYLRGSAILLENNMEAVKDALFVKEGKAFKISISALKELQPLETYLYELFKEYNFTAWPDVLNLLDAISGKVVYSATHELSKDRDFLWLRPIAPKMDTQYVYNHWDKIMNEPVTLAFEIVTEIEEKNNSAIYVDKEKLNLPLIVRKWNNGDYFYPFGMSGKKKVSKFFKDEKFSIIDKENQWILCSGKEIVWMIGRRADRRFSVEEQTETIIKIQLLQE